MPDDLYDRDILIWSEQQADLLRRLSAGERVNAAVDWTNLIEEVEDVGRSELRECESLLIQAIVHLAKLRAMPDGPTDHWEAEVKAFLDDAAAGLSPSMRIRIDMGRLYVRARNRLPGYVVAGLASLPDACPFSIDDLLAVPPEVAALAGKLG
jgi:Domain of unknown function DUF29